jgi:hypothetical protein
MTLLLLALLAAPADANVVETKPKLPAGLKAKGTLAVVATFSDANGENVVYIEKQSTKQGPELHAYGYAKKDTWQKIWQANDFVRDCDLDTVLAYVPGSLIITDKDADNLAETSFAYAIACKGDISADGLKLLMYEGATKYALRGETRITYDGKTEGGALPTDPELDRASAEFKSLMADNWRKVVEKTAATY